MKFSRPDTPILLDCTTSPLEITTKPLAGVDGDQSERLLG
jgi:hypothetical protein